LKRLACLATAIVAAALLTGQIHAGTAQSSYAAAGKMTDNAGGGADVRGESPVLIATGDFNGDGIADLVEATWAERYGSGSGTYSLTVLLGQADGKFSRVALQRSIGGDPRALVVGDFNGDGRPDVLVGDGNGAVEEFLGDGKGDMVDSGEIAKLGSVASMATGHFTHSGDLDLVVSDSGSNSAVIFLGTGKGTFRRTWSFRLPRMGREFHVATADFNKDGIDDLLIGSDEDDDYEVMLGNGNGTFTYAPALSRVRDPNSYCPS